MASRTSRPDGQPVSEKQNLTEAERAHIVSTLAQTNWVVGGRDGAAARLGLPRTTLISRMQRLGIMPDARGVIQFASHAQKYICN